MDDRQFDALSRRHASRLLTGGVLAGLLAHMPIGVSLAKKKGKKKKKGCKPGTKLCNLTGKCIPESACCGDSVACDRCAAAICLGGVCDCAPGFIRSNGACGFFRDCLSAGEVVDSLSDCCSDETVYDPGAGQRYCAAGKENCLAPNDCVSGGPCRGFMCPELYASITGGGC